MGLSQNLGGDEPLLPDGCRSVEGSWVQLPQIAQHFALTAPSTPTRNEVCQGVMSALPWLSPAYLHFLKAWAKTVGFSLDAENRCRLDSGAMGTCLGGQQGVG